MSHLAKLHIAKKQLGLDDELYRDTLERFTGKRSAKDMTRHEQETVLAHFRKAGFMDKTPRPADAVTKKIIALWLSGWNLGVIQDKRTSAMEAFVKRMTGIDKAAWLRNPKDAAKVIDALKAWLARDASVVWGGRDPMRDVIEAQLQRLRDLGLTIHAQDAAVNIETQRALGILIRKEINSNRRVA